MAELNINRARILVYGAGPLGSLFAARLLEAGHEVSLLSRGQRLADLREYGVVLVDTETGVETTAHPRIVDSLGAHEAYDLILVIMRKNQALQILPTLAANDASPLILFLMNNAAGPGELVHALGAERVLMGFPMAAGYRRGHIIHYLAGNAEDKSIVPIGEINGRITPRLEEVGQVLSSMAGFDVELRTDMDAWLKTHVALLMPSLAPALRAAGQDNVRLAHTRDAMLLALRAIREGFRVLKALGYPIVPTNIRIFDWVPEPVLVWLFGKRFTNPHVRVALVEHSEAAQDEIKHLADEFRRLCQQTSIPTPAMDRLYTYFDADTPPLPEGSRTLSMDWRFLWGIAGAAAGILVLGWAFSRLFCRKGKAPCQ